MSCLAKVIFTMAFIWFMAVLLGPKFDEVCLEGRFSAEQAEAVNSLPWGKCPSYKEGDCHIEEGDRMLSRECSEFSRWVFLQDWR